MNPELDGFEKDPFIDGLELGMWSEETEYYIPYSEWTEKPTENTSEPEEPVVLSD